MNLNAAYLSRSVGLINPPAPVVLSVSASLEETITALKQPGSGGAVLLVNDQNLLQGIFTERDYLKKCNLQKTSLKTCIVEVMTKNPTTIDMQTPFAFALRLMTEGGYRHIPITEDEEPIGIISMRDIVAEIVKSFVLPQE